MAQLRGLFSYVLVLVAFVGGLIGLLLFLRPDAEHAQEVISRLFEENTDCLMQVESVQPDGLVLPAIRMSGLRLFSPTGDEVAKLRWLQADLSLSELISGNVGISQIKLVEPDLKQAAFKQCFEKTQA